MLFALADGAAGAVFSDFLQGRHHPALHADLLQQLGHGVELGAAFGDQDRGHHKLRLLEGKPAAARRNPSTVEAKAPAFRRCRSCASASAASKLTEIRPGASTASSSTHWARWVPLVTRLVGMFSHWPVERMALSVGEGVGEKGLVPEATR